MAGSAILGDNLIDDLAPDIDDLRTDLYADFGVASFNFQVIKRTWLGSSGLEGDGVSHRQDRRETCRRLQPQRDP